MENSIQVYQNNSKTVVCNVTGLASLTGYTAVMTVKTAITATGTTFTSTGTTNGLTIKFELTPANTNIAPNTYWYDIVVTNGSKNYTVVQSVLTVLDSVKY
jgi:hypothetical protein